MKNPVIGFIGFGEAAFNICDGLHSAGIKEIYSFDKMQDDERFGPAIHARADKTQVTLVGSLQELLSHAAIIFCATSAKFAVGIAQEVAPFLKEDHIYVDLNSASPEVKKQIDEAVRGANSRFVDGAVMEPVPKHRHQVPIMASGNGATVLKDIMSPFEMNITVVNEHAGSASAMKMCRSIFMKGFTSLLIETMHASYHFNVDKEILASIENTLTGQPLEELADLLITRTAIHAERRVTEMEEVIKTLEEAQVAPYMSIQTKTVLQSLVDMGLKEQFNAQVPDSYRDVIKAIQSQT
ncbi:NAD(P)-dependent oxidoreductase [Planomicrobium sp. CPCC 101079]|uniref:NAD(P)-dependent oxidoreductase n=1 Tax=Planomicrobium sp. CPCC 101079 TaxID=2599618 RepID=UPI0011B3A27A|nr:DUF1932 domain-containing protein [Planomicrobium sp. CPCC 101079]TWT01801.1 NAD(P)-dependent oxidoreductase [Planomicrobium sp. CPCC 101079]